MRAAVVRNYNEDLSLETVPDPTCPESGVVLEVDRRRADRPVGLGPGALHHLAAVGEHRGVQGPGPDEGLEPAEQEQK